MEKIPLFILAGADQGDSFGQKRINQLRFKGQRIVDYLISQAKKSDCFSEIYLVANKNLKENVNQDYFLLEAQGRLWKNLHQVFSFVKKKYNQGESLIAILLSDILPSAEDIQDVFSRSAKYPDKDIFLLFTPSDNLIKHRGKMFVKKDEQSPAIAYSGTGGLYFLRPAQLEINLILAILSLRLPRDVRHIEISEDRIYCDALRSFKGVVYFIWMMLKIIFYSLFFIDKLFLLLKAFLKLRKKELTFDQAEIFLTKILVQNKYQKKQGHGVKIEIINKPVFVDDIDREEDVKVLIK